jgi:hypothetical protein
MMRRLLVVRRRDRRGVFIVPAPGEAKGAGGLSMAAQNAGRGRGLDSEQAVELMKG